MSATLRLELPKSLFPGRVVTVRVPRLPRFPLIGLGTLLAASIAWAQLPTPEPHKAPENLAIGKYDAATHAAEITAAGEYAVNAQNAISVKLVAKSGYHINDKYPLKFKVGGADDIKYPKPLLTREDGRFGKTTGELSVSFIATKPGKTRVGGTLSFSVCNEKNCLMDKVDLEVEVTVK